MSRRRHRGDERNRDREPSRNPWTACLYGTLWALQEPAGLLAPAPATHSFRFPVAEVIRFGKLRSIDKDAVQNFIQVGEHVYRVAFLSQTRAARKWISLHVARCKCPKLVLPDGSRRLQVIAWMRALQPDEVPAEELEREEPLLPGENGFRGRSGGFRNFS